MRVPVLKKEDCPAKERPPVMVRVPALVPNRESELAVWAAEV